MSEAFSEAVEMSFVTTRADQDKVECPAMEQEITAEEVISIAIGLYRTVSRLIADRPGGMVTYVVDGGYIEIETGIPGEATEDDHEDGDDEATT